MDYKIAVASSDGITVNQYFGRSEQFLIYEVNDEEWTYTQVEIRPNKAACQMGEHDNHALFLSAYNLRDCKYVIVSRVGPGARNALKDQGVEVYELPGIIEDSIEQMLNYLELQAFIFD